MILRPLQRDVSNMARKIIFRITQMFCPILTKYLFEEENVSNCSGKLTSHWICSEDLWFAVYIFLLLKSKVGIFKWKRKAIYDKIALNKVWSIRKMSVGVKRLLPRGGNAIFCREAFCARFPTYWSHHRRKWSLVWLCTPAFAYRIQSARRRMPDWAFARPCQRAWANVNGHYRPVSYTHLDVYKRQGRGWQIAWFAVPYTP